MNRRLFATLAEWLKYSTVVLASVIDTRGAAPRKPGSRMLIEANRSAFSVGGGRAESIVVRAAINLLVDDLDHGDVRIDLSGGPGAAGVCGGSMRVALKRWRGDADRARAQAIAGRLAAGERVVLAADAFAGDRDAPLAPDPRLLIVGGGHCAAALCDLARLLDYDLWVYDDREGVLDSASFAGTHRLGGDIGALRQAFDTARELQVVLLNRDFTGDVAALRAIAGLRADFIGMMGSRRRIHEVLAALPDQPGLADRLHAPVGIDIDAETPHEIAVSILAQLIAVRAATG
jgi:xanthine dehydrogenase accessory factor